MQKDKQEKAGHHVQLQNDILQSMGSQISDLQLSLSRISIKNKQLEEQLHKQRTKSCPQGHPMRYMYTKTTSDAKLISCDICDVPVVKSTNVFWSCRKCDFDLCKRCAGFKRSLCPFNHPLQFKEKYYVNARCDICHTSGIKSGWHCECDFDVCEECYSLGLSNN